MSNDATQLHIGKCTGGYKFIKSQGKVNHLIYIDNIKLFAKTEKELETLIQKIRIQSRYRNGTYYRKMCHVNSEKGKKINNRRNRNTKSRKNQNT